MLQFERQAALAFVRLGWRQALAQKATLAARAAMHLVVVMIFWHVWLATSLGEMAALDVDPAALTWYLAVTEWIIFAAGVPYRDVEYDVSGGMIEVGMGRPQPYALITLATWLGAAALRLIALGAFVLVAVWQLTGDAPPFGVSAVALPVVAFLAVLILLLCQLQIGYVAIWMGTAAPVFWLFQKFLFVLGGLILPITFYPPPFEAMASASPFAAMLAAPGAFALGATATDALVVLIFQLFWLAILTIATFLVDRRASSRLQQQGL